uniref:NmrA-like domain-containing protein n=1 Tax=Globisporangium ultimum (strain ATCC 200006 / CBS 805.95 / DAOM BR144) TaxID=431595 RepID=K3WWF9_GLOUD
MPLFKSFAVVGAGSFGAVVVTELLTRNVSVKVLTRDDTKSELHALKEKGASIVKVGYSDEQALHKALSDVDVVLSTISQFSLLLQIEIARIAKAAGVKLFVPAEYDVTVAERLNSYKKLVLDGLKGVEIPYTLFYTGFFTEFFSWFFDYNYAEGYISVVGDGNRPFSATTRLDIARFVAHVLTSAETSDLHNAIFRIEGDRKSPLEIAALAEKKLEKPIEIRRVDLEENRKKYNSDFAAFLTTLIADGRAVSGTKEEVDATINKFFPYWNPQPIGDFIEG